MSSAILGSLASTPPSLTVSAGLLPERPCASSCRAVSAGSAGILSLPCFLASFIAKATHQGPNCALGRHAGFAQRRRPPVFIIDSKGRFVKPQLGLRDGLLALAVVFVCGTNFVVIRLVLDVLPPLFFATLRFFFVLLQACLFLPWPES